MQRDRRARDRDTRTAAHRPRRVRQEDDARDRAVGAARDQTKEIAAQHLPFVLGRQVEGMHLCELDAGMQPRPVGAEQDLVRAGPLHRLLQQIEAADA